MKREKILKGFSLAMVMLFVLVLAASEGQHPAGAATAGSGSEGAKFDAVVEAARKEAQENPTAFIRYPGMRDEALRLTEQGDST